MPATPGLSLELELGSVDLQSKMNTHAVKLSNIDTTDSDAPKTIVACKLQHPL